MFCILLKVKSGLMGVVHLFNLLLGDWLFEFAVVCSGRRYTSTVDVKSLLYKGSKMDFTIMDRDFCSFKCIVSLHQVEVR